MHEEYLYKQKLLNTFGNDNELVDNVKLHLRQKIINKLQANKASQQVPVEKELVAKISASLFMDYLQAHRLFHSASVFAPESGFSRGAMTSDQLCSLLRVDTTNSDSILQAVLKQVLPKGRLTEKRTQSGVQTDCQESIQNLQNRLNQVQFSYKQKVVAGLKNAQDLQLRMLKYRNELNKRYKEDLDAEINRVRSFQIANIRMEEQEKNRLKMKQLEEELQNNYRLKMEKLRERQAEVIQRVANKMKEVETYNYQARQRVLKDIESVRIREQELGRARQELQERERNLTRQKE